MGLISILPVRMKGYLGKSLLRSLLNLLGSLKEIGEFAVLIATGWAAIAWIGANWGWPLFLIVFVVFFLASTIWFVKEWLERVEQESSGGS